MKRASYPWRTVVLAHACALLTLGTVSVASLATAPAASAQTLVQAGSREQAVTVRGNRRIEAETILSYMDLAQGQTVTAEDLNRAVRRLFDTGLFKDVQIIPAQDQLIVEVALKGENRDGKQTAEQRAQQQKRENDPAAKPTTIQHPARPGGNRFRGGFESCCCRMACR